MIPWREFVYDFPDDGGTMLDTLVGLLPDRHQRDLVCTPLEGYRLRDISVTVMIFLLMAVPSLKEPADSPLLNPGELYVPYHRRLACERVLSAQSVTSHRWSTLECVSGGHPALIAFDQIWQQNVIPLL